MHAACLIDVRCLQEPAQAASASVRHARALLRHARTGLPGARLVGIADPALPPLDEGVMALVDAVRLNAYAGAPGASFSHVQLSPLTHDPMFVARVLTHPAIPSATVVHDHALDEPSGPANRIDRLLRLRFLARHTLFLAVSASVADRLHRLLGVPDSRIEVTGNALHGDDAACDRFWRGVRRLLPRPVGESIGTARGPARERLGLRPHEVAIACPGGLHAGHEILHAAWALDLLRTWGVDAHLLVLGGVPNGEVLALIEQLGLQQQIRFCGEHRDQVLAADVALHLHFGGPAPPFDLLADCVECGLPVVASACLASCVDLPGDARLISHRHSPVLIADAVLSSLRAARHRDAP